MSRIATRTNLLKAIIFIWPIVFVLFCIYLKVRMNDVYKTMVREDAVIEDMTCVLYLVASVIALSIARRFFKAQRKRYGWLYVLVFLFFAFVAMEEISWGQRIFDTQTPARFAAYNGQDETTVHNLHYIRPLVGEVYMLISLAGACAWLLMRHSRMKNLRHGATYFIPDWYLSLYFLFSFFIVIWMEVTAHWGRYVFFNWRDTEPGEMLVSLGFCLFMVVTKCRQVQEVRVERPAVEEQAWAVAVSGSALETAHRTPESDEVGTPAVLCGTIEAARNTSSPR